MGNIFSSLIATLLSDEMILRIEDLDPDRSKQEFIDSVMRDLDWFGFEWVGEVLYQSADQRQEAYRNALSALEEKGLVYPCYCSRADLHSARAPHVGEEYPYQNTCKHLSLEERKIRELERDPALRLDVTKDSSIASAGSFYDRFQGNVPYDLVKSSGDFIIRRSDGIFAYQLAVVVDDAASGITSVVRGVDLLSSTPKQLYLQGLLECPHPAYGHVPIFVDEQGRKLSKRNKDASLSFLVDELGMSAEEILGYLAFISGIIPDYRPMSIADLRGDADLDALNKKKRIVWKAPC